jgi:hypothetical protein
LSGDEKYIYANSGARTDHGEVQDDGGLYPNQRDNILTQKFFAFLLKQKIFVDAGYNTSATYIFAEGIRNAYDIAIDGKGNLFAVSNSVIMICLKICFD